MKTIMNKKLLPVSLLVLILSSCSSDNKESQETTFYKKEPVNQKKLELSIEASGIIEAISSVEIKSKASGEILLLGAEVGYFVKNQEELYNKLTQIYNVFGLDNLLNIDRLLVDDLEINNKFSTISSSKNLKKIFKKL